MPRGPTSASDTAGLLEKETIALLGGMLSSLGPFRAERPGLFLLIGTGTLAAYGLPFPPHRASGSTTTKVHKGDIHWHGSHLILHGTDCEGGAMVSDTEPLRSSQPGGALRLPWRQCSRRMGCAPGSCVPDGKNSRVRSHGVRGRVAPPP